MPFARQVVGVEPDPEVPFAAALEPVCGFPPKMAFTELTTADMPAQIPQISRAAITSTVIRLRRNFFAISGSCFGVAMVLI